MCLVVSLCNFVRLSASCHITTCFFVAGVHFSLVTSLFCFVSLATLLAIFCGLLSIYMCVYLHLSVSF